MGARRRSVTNNEIGLMNRNIDLTRENERLKDAIDRSIRDKNIEYRKLWKENEELRKIISDIQNFTQNLPRT